MSLRGILLYLSLALSLIGVGVWAQGGPGPVPTNITCGSGLTCSPNPITGFGSIAATGSGSVTQVNVGACLTGGPITTTGTLVGAAGVDPRTSTVEALLNTDQCELVTFNNGSPVAASIAQAGVGGNFNSFWSADLLNLGAGTVTLTPAVSTVNGSATLVLLSGQGCKLFSDGTNYEAQCGQAPLSPVYLGTLHGDGSTGNVTFSSLPGYNSYELHLDQITQSGGSGQPLFIRLNGDGGSHYGYSGLLQGSAQALPTAFYNSSDTSIFLLNDNSSDNSVSGWIKVSGGNYTSPGGPATGPAVSWSVTQGYTDDYGYWVRSEGGGMYDTTSNLSSISVYLYNLAGPVSLWGYPNE